MYIYIYIFIFIFFIFFYFLFFFAAASAIHHWILVFRRLRRSGSQSWLDVCTFGCSKCWRRLPHC